MKKSERIAILEEKVDVLERRLDFTPNPKKRELEVGKWYKGFNGSLCFLSKIDGAGHTAYGYGFSSDGNWMNQQVLPGLIHSPHYCSPAPIKEVHNALAAEARKRGLVRDAVIKSIVSPYGSKETLEGNYHFPRYPIHFNLGRNTILCEGVWAEPVLMEMGINIPDKFTELKEAERNGKNIECRIKDFASLWVEKTHKGFFDSFGYRIKPEEGPKVGDVCKFWNYDERNFEIAQLIKIYNEKEIYRYASAASSWRKAKTLNKQEAIKLLFGESEITTVPEIRKDGFLSDDACSYKIDIFKRSKEEGRVTVYKNKNYLTGKELINLLFGDGKDN